MPCSSLSLPPLHPPPPPCHPQRPVTTAAQCISPSLRSTILYPPPKKGTPQAPPEYRFHSTSFHPPPFPQHPPRAKDGCCVGDLRRKAKVPMQTKRIVRGTHTHTHTHTHATPSSRASYSFVPSRSKRLSLAFCVSYLALFLFFLLPFPLPSSHSVLLRFSSLLQLSPCFRFCCLFVLHNKNDTKRGSCFDRTSKNN